MATLATDYKQLRNARMGENQKRLQALGLVDISRSLSSTPLLDDSKQARKKSRVFANYNPKPPLDNAVMYDEMRVGADDVRAWSVGLEATRMVYDVLRSRRSSQMKVEVAYEVWSTEGERECAYGVSVGGVVAAYRHMMTCNRMKKLKAKVQGPGCPVLSVDDELEWVDPGGVGRGGQLQRMQ
ncbi:hypothetical protein L7F22_007929, partial [Adiantum nelumboides]|nr:hypothetical protein [Adiantum nelumboides]